MSAPDAGHFHWRLLAGFLAAACAYLFLLDPWGHDTWFHLQRLQDIERQLEWGHWRAYFAENAAQGKGLPVWIYYSQWIYWPAILLTAIGVSPLVALKLVYSVLLVVCCVGCYQLLRSHAGENEAAFGTLLFMTSNYVVGEVFQRSAYSEFMSVALLPMLLVAMHRVVLHDDRRAGTTLAVLAALMILAHPLSFMNSGIALAAYAAFVGVKDRVPPGRFLRLVPLFALGLALSAFYWLPAVIETKYVLGAEGVPTPLSETFLSIGRYLKFSGITSLGLVLTLLAPVVTACIVLRRGRPVDPAERSWWPLLAAVAVYVFLTFRVSEPLYDALPLLASNLWVWRVLFQVTLLTALIVAVGLPALPQRLRSPAVLRGLALVGVLQATALVAWNARDEVSLRPMPVRAIEARIAVESQLKDGFGIDEYLPQPRLLPRLDGECAYVRTMEPNGRYEMSYVVVAGYADACIHIPRYWNTRYVASIDGVPTPVYGDRNGEVLIAPEGRSGLLTVRFASTGYVMLANVLSAAAALLLLVRVARRRG
jgi:hypothetical protein